MSFLMEDGYLFCEDLPIKTICDRVGQTPFYLYSTKELRNNFAAYADSLEGFPSVISYAVKANGNPFILKLLRELGCWATLVSGGEFHLARATGFTPDQMILNGNGKTLSELRLAIEFGSIINIDSDFDLEHIKYLSDEVKKPVRVLLRINPDIDPNVHPYISTGLKYSKFGNSLEQIPTLLAKLKEVPLIRLIGLHCHLGSTISDLDVFHQTMEIMVGQFSSILNQGFPLKYLNLGGGLGIDYLGNNKNFPTPYDLVTIIKDLIPKGATLILEPGRSLVGSTGVLVCSVIGVKSGDVKNFIVVDGSMTELLRPSLYNAYHRIEFIEPVVGKSKLFDVVGPVCESTDFLGKDRDLPIPKEGTGIAVFDAGAYGYAMSSNYNARLRPPEYIFDRGDLIQIRKSEHYDDLLESIDFIPEN